MELQKATPLQDEQYQKRVARSTLSECLSAEERFQEQSGLVKDVPTHGRGVGTR